VKAVLFDLDGTLLDIDLSAFLDRYFAALSETVASLVPPDRVASAMQAISQSTEAMMRPHPGLTNKDVFHREFLELASIDLDTQWSPFQSFYDQRFPSLGNGYGPCEGAHEALAAAEECGLQVAIATNPIFPLAAVEHRLSWAGIDARRAHVVTTYETMHSCKPHPDYFRETAAMLGTATHECLMVGDDPVLDMAAADVGMQTYFVGAGPAHATYTGDLAGVASLLRRVCD
jgi:FMN phosphatase YigB (HAD superfamily)